MTIVVVGHGRSPEGKGWGERIDCCASVVRMWDWTPWQQPADYGRAYDYGLFVLTPKGLRIFMEHNFCYPRKGWLAYVGKPTPGELPSGPPIETLDLERWCRMAKAMGGAGVSGRFTLTRGAAAAAWAIEKSTMYSSPRVILVGFDNVLCGINQPIEQSFNPEYWQQYLSRFLTPKARSRKAHYQLRDTKIQKVYPIGTAKTVTHDMAIELPLLRQLAQRNGVELKFAQEVWT